MHSSGGTGGNLRDRCGGKCYHYKTKGHRVIAMPPCFTGLAPPAFTAPCRNQTSDCAAYRGKGRARLIPSENGEISRAPFTQRPQISCVFLQICPATSGASWL